MDEARKQAREQKNQRLQEIIQEFGLDPNAKWTMVEFDVPSEDELEEVILPVAKVLKRESHNWVRFWDSSNRSFYESPEVLYKDLLTPDQILMFNEICPTCEGGIHSIESISITPWVEDQLIFP